MYEGCPSKTSVNSHWMCMVGFPIEGIRPAVFALLEYCKSTDGVHVKSELEWEERRLSAACEFTEKSLNVLLWTSRHGNRKTSSLWRKSANTASDSPSEHPSAEEVIGFKYNSFRADPCLWECSFGGFLAFYRNTFVCVCLSLGSPERSSGVVACDITEELCQRTRKIWSRSDEDVTFALEKLDLLLTQWTYVWTTIKCSYSGHDVPVKRRNCEMSQVNDRIRSWASWDVHERREKRGTKETLHRWINMETSQRVCFWPQSKSEGSKKIHVFWYIQRSFSCGTTTEKHRTITVFQFECYNMVMQHSRKVFASQKVLTHMQHEVWQNRSGEQNFCVEVSAIDPELIVEEEKKHEK